MAEHLHSAKSWAAAAFQLVDLLTERLTELSVLSEADVQKMRSDAISGLAIHSDVDFRAAADLLRAVYVPPVYVPPNRS